MNYYEDGYQVVSYYIVDSSDCYENLLTILRKLFSIQLVESENFNYKLTLSQVNKEFDIGADRDEFLRMVAERKLVSNSSAGDSEKNHKVKWDYIHYYCPTAISSANKRQISKIKSPEEGQKEYSDKVNFFLNSIYKSEKFNSTSMLNELMYDKAPDGNEDDGLKRNSKNKKWNAKTGEEWVDLCKTVQDMRCLDVEVLLAEMNKIILELKKVSNEKQDLESKQMLDSINRQNDEFSKLLDNNALDNSSSMLSKIYSKLTENVRNDLNSYMQKMKDLNLEKQNLLDECRYHRLNERNADHLVEFMVKKFDFMSKKMKTQESEIYTLKNNLLNLKLHFEKSTGCTHYVFKFYSHVSESLLHFKRLFTKKFHANFATSFQAWVDTKLHEACMKGRIEDLVRDPNFFLQNTTGPLRKTIDEYFEEYINRFLHLDIVGFQKENDKLLEKEQVILDNNRFKAKIDQLESSEKDYESLYKKNETIVNQLNYYKSNFKNLMTQNNSDGDEGNSNKDLYNQNKNLEFYSEMLVKEKESLLEQIRMYNDINLECFERIKELKSLADNQFHTIQKMQTTPNDLEHIRTILDTSDNLYESTINQLYYSFEMVQSRFNCYNEQLYELIKHYSSYCMSVFTNSHPGFDKDWFMKRWQNTLERLEIKLQQHETNLTELTNRNAQMQKTIVTFTKREILLVKDLESVKKDTRDKDIRIDYLEKMMQEAIVREDILKKEKADLENANEHIIKKFNYYFKDSKLSASLNKGNQNASLFEVAYLNRLTEVENVNYKINKDIINLKDINYTSNKKIDKYLALIQAKDVRYNNLENKYNEILIDFNDLRTKRRTESIEEFTSMMKYSGTNDTYVLMIQKLRKEYEQQIEMLMSRLKQIASKYSKHLDLDLVSKYKILTKDYNHSLVKNVNLENELKICKYEKEQLKKKVKTLKEYINDEKVNEINYEEIDKTYFNYDRTELLKFIVQERINYYQKHKEYDYLMHEYANLQNQTLEKWTWIHQLNSSYHDLVQEHLNFKEELNDSKIDDITYGDDSETYIAKQMISEYESEVKEKMLNLKTELNLLERENKNLQSALKEAKKRETNLNSTLNKVNKINTDLNSISHSISINDRQVYDVDDEVINFSTSDRNKDQNGSGTNRNTSMTYNQYQNQNQYKSSSMKENNQFPVVKVRPVKSKKLQYKYVDYSDIRDELTPSISKDEYYNDPEISKDQSREPDSYRNDQRPNNSLTYNSFMVETNNKVFEPSKTFGHGFTQIWNKRSATPSNIKDLGSGQRNQYRIGSSYGIRRRKEISKHDNSFMAISNKNM